MIAAGKLDRRVTIEQPSVAADAYGGQVTTWTTFKVAWAEVRPIRGAERFEAMAQRAARFEVFRIRYLSGVTPKMRIVWDGRVYNIRNIAEVGRREGLDLMAEAEN